jgi:hypothetical protein
VGGLFLFYIAYYVIQQDVGSAVPILATAGLGVPLLVLAGVTNRSGFFREKTVSYVMVEGKLTASTASPTNAP